MHEKLKKLSENRIKYLIENPGSFYKGNETYLDAIQNELKEAEEQIKDNNFVYLEDELGDVFWTYICLLYSLKSEGKISSVEKIFERAYKKISERIGDDGKNSGIWNDIKALQKEELKIEHNKIFSK